MNISELRKAMEYWKTCGFADRETNPVEGWKYLQTLLSACQLLCDTSDKLPSKKDLFKPHKRCLEDSKTRCYCLNDCVEERDNFIDDFTLYIAKKLTGVEGVIEKYDDYAENALDKNDKKSNRIANAIIQLFGQNNMEG